MEDDFYFFANKRGQHNTSNHLQNTIDFNLCFTLKLTCISVTGVCEQFAHIRSNRV